MNGFFKFLLLVFVLYLVNQICKKNDMSKIAKLVYFLILACIPAILGLFLFDFTVILQMPVFVKFDKLHFLLLISTCVIFVVVLLSIRFLSYLLFAKIEGFDVMKFLEESKFSRWIYGASVEVLMYAILPIIISVLLQANYFQFMVISLLSAILLMLLGAIMAFFRNKKVPNEN